VKRLWLAIACSAPLLAQADPTFVSKLAEKYKPHSEPFYFAAMGDQQYGADGEAKWPALAASIQADSRLQFVIHAGDIKSGSTRCDDALYENRLRAFTAFTLPFILTPGDNEWTDCHRANNGAYDPLERLAKLRQMFFSGDSSLGQRTIPLTRQSEEARYSLYRENELWTHGGLVFAALHIIGSNNNLGRTPENDAEYKARNQATLDWMRTAFALAKTNRFDGVVLVFQAEPYFPLISEGKAKTTAGFTDTLRVMQEESQAFGKPVLAIHGDSHFFRFDKPLARDDGKVLDNFFRLEVPGEADAHWVRVDIDPTTPSSPFRVQHITVPDNANR
jgi:hypothetical protein